MFLLLYQLKFQLICKLINRIKTVVKVPTTTRILNNCISFPSHLTKQKYSATMQILHLQCFGWCFKNVAPSAGVPMPHHHCRPSSGIDFPHISFSHTNRQEEEFPICFTYKVGRLHIVCNSRSYVLYVGVELTDEDVNEKLSKTDTNGDDKLSFDGIFLETDF